MVKNKKSFQDGKIIKEALIEAVGLMLRDSKNKAKISSAIKALQLVTWRCEAMVAEDLIQQMWKNVEDCDCFSLQLDEFTDVSDTAQMCIFIQWCLVISL